MHSWWKELDAGCAIARRAGRIALRYREQDIGFESKHDASPVTVADRECERVIVEMLSERFPDDGVLGEEGASHPGTSGRRWIIDPIDGTRDYVRGNYAWGVLIALEDHGEVVAGFCYLAAVDELYVASKGGGAFLNDVRVRCSEVDSVANAVLSVNGLNTVLRHPFAPELLEWMRPFWAVRSMGGCLDAMMITRGQADMWIEVSAKPWDLAPLKILAEEAGARFFNLDGGSSIYGGNCILSVPGLESHARAFFCRGRAGCK